MCTGRCLGTNRGATARAPARCAYSYAEGLVTRLANVREAWQEAWARRACTEGQGQGLVGGQAWPLGAPLRGAAEGPGARRSSRGTTRAGERRLPQDPGCGAMVRRTGHLALCCSNRVSPITTHHRLAKPRTRNTEGFLTSCPPKGRLQRL